MTLGYRRPGTEPAQTIFPPEMEVVFNSWWMSADSEFRACITNALANLSTHGRCLHEILQTLCVRTHLWHGFTVCWNLRAHTNALCQFLREQHRTHAVKRRHECYKEYSTYTCQHVTHMHKRNVDFGQLQAAWGNNYCGIVLRLGFEFKSIKIKYRMVFCITRIL